MRNNIGRLLIILSLCITLGLWLNVKEGESLLSIFTNFRYLGQISALIGVMLFVWEFVLAIKAHWLENIFGGLDKLYQIHHGVGAWAFVFLINHPLLLAINTLPDTNGALTYFWFGNMLSYNLGIIALYSLLLLIVATIYFKLPYNIWYNTHIYMGVPMFFAIIHTFLIKSDISENQFLKLWIYLWLGIALVSYIYKRFLYKYLTSRYEYVLERIEKAGDILVLSLKPLNKKMNFRPGQFVFTTFDSKVTGGESHPYSFASNPNDENIRLGIKRLGDYTLKLPSLKVGTKTELIGPFGNFFDRSFVKDYNEVWIAGGIGITPFLSMLEFRKEERSAKEITFYYSVVNKEEGVFNKYIQSVVGQIPNFSYKMVCTAKDGYLNAEKIKNSNGGSLENTLFFVCGPKPMMASLNAQLRSGGVKQQNIIFEDYSLR